MSAGKNGDVFFRAVRAFETGRADKAEPLLKRVLDEDAMHFDALHLLGVIKSRDRQFASAMRLFDRAVALRPRNADLLNNRGAALTELLRFDDALADYDRALSIRKDFASAHNNRGCLLMAMERYAEALASHGHALVLDPDNAEFVINLGRALARLKRYEEALDCFDDAIALDPTGLDALINRGVVLDEAKCHDEAVLAFDKVLEVRSDDIDILCNRANALNGGKRHGEALVAFDTAIAIAPTRSELWIGKSMTLAKLDRLADAYDGFERALALGAKRSDVLVNRAFANLDLGRIDAAVADSAEAVALCPESADTHNVYGLAALGKDAFATAIEAFKRALDIRPAFPLVVWNLGYLSLLCGDFAEGWRRYEGRRYTDGTRWTRLDGPEWSGQSLEGKRLLLYAEQAFGDTIHFARYAGLMADRGATVILGVYAPLAELLRTARGVREITRHKEHTPPYHYHMPLMSVPHALAHASEDDIPGEPYLRADPERVARWGAILGDSTLKVGIAWQGSLAIPGRSIPLSAFAPLAALPGVTLIGLQKSDGLDQLHDLPAGMRVQTLGPLFDQGPDAFLDTAAVMMNLDLVISCDTAVAHLAGALGRPLWIVLKAVPDWRWMLDRGDSPWYSTARLFRRQGANQDWSRVMHDVAIALQSLVQSA
jgi:tetratricopeptide (TPR) repeat protein